MRHWLVLHDYEAYREEPLRIGRGINLRGKIDKIRRGDRILYYAVGAREVIGSFNVVSEGEEYAPSNPENRKWKGRLWSYRIAPRSRKKTTPVSISLLMNDASLKTFPKKPIQFKGRTVIPLSSTDFRRIEMMLMAPSVPSNLFKGPANEGNLGEPADLRILNYAPTSEPGVVVLFANFMRELEAYDFVKLEFVRSGFPDACVIQRVGDSNYARKYIEFEFRASGFRAHEKNQRHRNVQCDFVVCWENDYPSCPVKVIELKTEIQKILGRPRNREAA